MNLLYLGGTVLILVDEEYIRRFWTSAEAWLSMRSPARDGLGTSRNSRCDIECIWDMPSSFARALRDEWRDCDAKQAARKLAGPDFVVTNPDGATHGK